MIFLWENRILTCANWKLGSGMGLPEGNEKYIGLKTIDAPKWNGLLNISHYNHKIGSLLGIEISLLCKSKNKNLNVVVVSDSRVHWIASTWCLKKKITFRKPTLSPQLKFLLRQRRKRKPLLCRSAKPKMLYDNTICIKTTLE